MGCGSMCGNLLKELEAEKFVKSPKYLQEFGFTDLCMCFRDSEREREGEMMEDDESGR